MQDGLGARERLALRARRAAARRRRGSRGRRCAGTRSRRRPHERDAAGSAGAPGVAEDADAAGGRRRSGRRARAAACVLPGAGAGRAARGPRPAATVRSTSLRRWPRTEVARERADLDAGCIPLIICTTSDHRRARTKVQVSVRKVARLWRTPPSPRSISEALARDAAGARARAERHRRRARGAGAARRAAPTLPGSTPICTSTTSPRCARIPGHPGEEAPRTELWGADGHAARARARPARAQRSRRRRRPGHRAVGARTRGRARSRTAACTGAARST